MQESMPQAEAIGSFTLIGDHRTVLATSTDLASIVMRGQEALRAGQITAASVFDDSTGKRTDVDGQVTVARVQECLGIPLPAEKRQGPGRPKLGVISREVSLLPRHWDWLSTQPGGASAALRRLIEAASKQNRLKDLVRQQRDATHAFMWMLGADLPGFEEASRALYAGNYAQVGTIAETQGWPADLREHIQRLVTHLASLDTLAHEEDGSAAERAPEQAARPVRPGRLRS